jgi:integrase
LGTYPEYGLLFLRVASQSKRGETLKMGLSALTLGKVEDFLETIPSKHTRKNYLNGIKKFEQWYGDSIAKLIKSPDATRTVEKFYVWLRQKHPQNTCRNITNAVIQFLKYFGTDVKPRKALGIYRTEVSTSDHRLTIDEVQRMASVANLKEQIILEVLLLGLRIGDAITLKVNDFKSRLEQEAPIPITIKARKEGTVYETFISQEFKELLQLYLPTVKGEWLFPGIRKGSHAKDETLNITLKNLAKRAGIQLHGRLHWHCGRKLVMRTGAELGISPWIIKRMVGKSIPKSDDTYLSDMNLKEAFLKLSSVLKLKPNIANGRISNVERLVQKTCDAIAEYFKPIIRQILMQEMMQSRTGTLGLIEMPNIDKMSSEQIIDLYLKLARKEKT